MSGAEAFVRITQDDMETFAAASGDRNPLHVSREYARSTPFGEPVVYGCLAALAALGRLPRHDGRTVASIALEFRAPLAVGVDYGVEVVSETEVRLLDLGALALGCNVVVRPDAEAANVGAGSPTGRAEPARYLLPELQEATASGAWGPSPSHLDALITRFDLGRRGLAPLAVALLWASYVAGMELPGERALLWRIDLDLPQASPAQLPLDFRAHVSRTDTRVDLVEVEAELGAPEAPLAAGTIRAFVRPDPIQTDPALLPHSDLQAGKLAVVIGASRGLGAAIAQALALAGASVLAVHRDSAAAAESLRTASGSVEVLQGDAADPGWCRDVLALETERLGAIDILVCNASPPIRPLPFVPDGLDRFDEFVSESVRLVAAPLSSLLPRLAERGGTVLLVSSSAVVDPPAEWPHYVTAKAGVEGLAAWVAAVHPSVRVVVARPTKLLTDQMNTLLGRTGAGRVEPVAAGLVETLSTPGRGGGVELVSF